jgi:hypothetical protein
MIFFKKKKIKKKSKRKDGVILGGGYFAFKFLMRKKESEIKSFPLKILNEISSNFFLQYLSQIQNH